MHLFPTGLAPSDARTVRDKIPLHRARVASPVTITACVLPATVAAGGAETGLLLGSRRAVP